MITCLFFFFFSIEVLCRVFTNRCHPPPCDWKWTRPTSLRSEPRETEGDNTRQKRSGKLNVCNITLFTVSRTHSPLPMRRKALWQTSTFNALRCSHSKKATCEKTRTHLRKREVEGEPKWRPKRSIGWRWCVPSSPSCWCSSLSPRRSGTSLGRGCTALSQTSVCGMCVYRGGSCPGTPLWSHTSAAGGSILLSSSWLRTKSCQVRNGRFCPLIGCRVGLFGSGMLLVLMVSRDLACLRFHALVFQCVALTVTPWQREQLSFPVFLSV